MKSDTEFMEIALDEARKASWPFGAILVRNSEIIAQAGSGDGGDNPVDPTAHAEVNLIRRASQKLGTGDLGGSILYASCEPCAMCFSAAWYANIREIIFGSSLDDIQKINSSWGGDLAFPQERVADTGIQMRGGVLRDEVMKMYSSHPRTVN